jgi:hypothetical protein
MSGIQTGFFSHPFVNVSDLPSDFVGFDDAVLVGIEHTDHSLCPFDPKSQAGSRILGQALRRSTVPPPSSARALLGRDFFYKNADDHPEQNRPAKELLDMGSHGSLSSGGGSLLSFYLLSFLASSPTMGFPSVLNPFGKGMVPVLVAFLSGGEDHDGVSGFRHAPPHSPNFRKWGKTLSATPKRGTKNPAWNL